MNVETKSNEELKVNEESLEAFTVVYAENPSGLYTKRLVPIYENMTTAICLVKKPFDWSQENSRQNF